MGQMGHRVTYLTFMTSMIFMTCFTAKKLFQNPILNTDSYFKKLLPSTF
jgi:hypothetical protein